LAVHCQLERKRISVSMTAVIHAMRSAIQKHVVCGRCPTVAHDVVAAVGKSHRLLLWFVSGNASKLPDTFCAQEPECFFCGFNGDVLVITSLKKGRAGRQCGPKIVGRSLVQHHQSPAIVVAEKRRRPIGPRDEHEVIQK